MLLRPVMPLVFVVPQPDYAAGGIGLPYALGLSQSLTFLGLSTRLQDAGAGFAITDRPVIDGILLPGFHDRLDELGARRAIAIMHHSASRPPGSAISRDDITQSLRTILPRLSHVICTNQAVAYDLISQFGVAPGSITVIAPGNETLPRATPPAGSCAILSTGVLTRRKQHEVLLRILAKLGDLDWALTIVGSATRDPAYAAELNQFVTDENLSGRVSILTESAADQIEPLWQRAGLFASLTRWEGYPAAVAQAVRRGIPVMVSAAASSLVTPAAGTVCSDEDEATMSKVLRRLLFDAKLRATMADAAWILGQTLPDWPTQARLFVAAIGI